MLVTYFHEKLRCAHCKNEDLFGRTNGDLFCRKCGLAADPDDPEQSYNYEIANVRVELVKWLPYGKRPNPEPCGDGDGI